MSWLVAARRHPPELAPFRKEQDPHPRLVTYAMGNVLLALWGAVIVMGLAR